MAYGYDDARYTHKQNLEAWHRAVHGQVTVVQYYGDNFSEPWVMPPFALAIQRRPPVPPEPRHRGRLFPDLSARLLVERTV